MFVENINNLENKKFNSAISQVVELIKKTKFEDLAEGKYDVDGQNIFYVVSKGKTHKISEANAEAHEIYADIQYIHDGSEIIQWSNDTDLTISTPYDSQKDLKFFYDSNKFSDVKLYKGDFMYIAPEEVHKPSCHMNGKQEEVLKIVFKIHKKLL